MPRVKGRKPMRETKYRASRVCRVLGNPLAYQLVRAIGSGKRTPTDLAKQHRTSIQAVSTALRGLRLIDVVRYEADHGRVWYWLKHPRLLRLLAGLERLTDRMRWTRT